MKTLTETEFVITSFKLKIDTIIKCIGIAKALLPKLVNLELVYFVVLVSVCNGADDLCAGLSTKEDSST